jgi:exodeoxyribonuclease VII large subunit
VLKRRFPAIPVVIYPAAVQGGAAVLELIDALTAAERRAECDVIIIGRGGGSLEDLWAFNDETLARRIRACRIPVVSAVGHEVDFTIADFVADLRAATPSGAAELVVPDQAEWQRTLHALTLRLGSLLRRQLESNHQRLDWVARRLAQGSPSVAVTRQSERLRNLHMRLISALRHDLSQRRYVVESIRARLLHRSPAARMDRVSYLCQSLDERLRLGVRGCIGALQHRLDMLSRTLHSVSPLGTLQRGYAIVSDAQSGKVLIDAAKVEPGTTIQARLAHGELLANVTGQNEHGKLKRRE